MVKAKSGLDALKLWFNVTAKALREAPVDLSTRQMGIMLSVYLSPDKPHSVGTLAHSLGISKPAVCRALDSLINIGFIKRKRDDDDRRKIIVQRTVKGSVFLSEFADIITASSKA